MKSKLPGQRFKNPANTNVYYWGGKLIAAWESGLPYLLDPATLETKGKETLNGVLKESHCLAAHFRYDSAADRLVTFRFGDPIQRLLYTRLALL
jgi:all-trans-8'-apo-beta-carotenal 15,15'-oxygenase